MREYSEAFDNANDKAIALSQSQITNAIDRARGEVLGFLYEMHESPGCLLTQNHEFVQIDNEQMFTNASANLWECDWIRTADGEWSEAGVELAKNLCKEVANLSSEVTIKAMQILHDFEFKMSWSVPSQIKNLPHKVEAFLENINSVFGS